jgi:Ca-activated chloride channel homolog
VTRKTALEDTFVWERSQFVPLYLCEFFAFFSSNLTSDSEVNSITVGAVKERRYKNAREVLKAVLRVGTTLVLLMFIGSTFAQDTGNQDKDFSVSVDVQLVQLPVSVLDKDGRPINGLGKNDFEVFEDGVSQEISFFKHEDVPLSMGLVIDNSGSMHNKRERVNDAALSFVRESNPEDEAFIVNFDDAAYLEQDFTNKMDDLIRALGFLDTRGETALYDALYLSAVHVTEGKKDKKALLVITDGEDNRSKYSLDKVLAKLRELKVTVYAIGLLEEEDARGKSTLKKARDVLQKFADTTGGQAFFPKSVDQIGELCHRIAHDLRNQYTLGYTPSNQKLDGSWRKITVRLNSFRSPSRVTVRAKEGYYAPKTRASQ